MRIRAALLYRRRCLVDRMRTRGGIRRQRLLNHKEHKERKTTSFGRVRIFTAQMIRAPLPIRLVLRLPEAVHDRLIAVAGQSGYALRPWLVKQLHQFAYTRLNLTKWGELPTIEIQEQQESAAGEDCAR